MEQNSVKGRMSNFFSYYAEKTWHELKLVQHGRIRMNETTITQNLVKDLLVHSDMMRLPIYVYETLNEAANGNDIEIWIETSFGFVLVPTQVKIIKKNKYPTISHKVAGVAQIDFLMDYALKSKGIPAYLFYNYFDELYFSEYVEQIFPSLDEKQFGCTIGNAYSIYNDFYFRKGERRWIIPSFADIHVSSLYAIPLLCIINELIYGGVNELMAFSGMTHKNLVKQIEFFNFEHLHSNKSWKAHFFSGGISGISKTPFMGDPLETAIEQEPQIISHFGSLYSFSPMYRIIISRDHQFGLSFVN